jgi:predicted transcriptional regulator
VTTTPHTRSHLHAVLSRRERQIMDILYQLGRATAADLMKALPGS